MFAFFRTISFDDWVGRYKKSSKGKSKEQKRTNYQRPPLVQGHLFWGNAKDFADNAAMLIQSVSKNYGSMAILRFICRRVVVLTDVHSFSAFSHEQHFDFRPIIDQFNRNVFGFQVRPKQVDEHRRRLVQFYKSGKMSETIQLFDRHLNKTLDEHDQRGVDYKLDNLFVEIGFMSILQTLIGTEQQQQQQQQQSQDEDRRGAKFVNEKQKQVVQFYKNYKQFAKVFNYLWLGLPHRLFPSACQAMARLLQLHPTVEQLKQRHDVCPYLAAALSMMRGHGSSDQDILRHSIELVHVHANVIRLAYWMLVLILSDKEAAQFVSQEIDEMVRLRSSTCQQIHGGGGGGGGDGGGDVKNDIDLFIDLDEIEQMAALNSVLCETLRITSGIIVVRGVTHDTIFTTDKGEKFQLNQGDTVFFYPPAHHRDPDVFEEPDKFKWDRFLNGATFAKNGKTIEKPLLSFGNLCIGQRFAGLIARWLIIQLFHRWNLTLTGPVPKLNEAYQGHEILPPVGDTTVTFEPRPGARPKLCINGTNH